ncbi:MAG: hypothetical protein IKK18_00810 [Clostridia bacterium]|nr:hypothetical protein [Clostridia bacterium]
MFTEEFKVLKELSADLETMRGYLNGLRSSRYGEAYKQIMLIAHRADGISKCQFGTIVARMERARYCLSEEVLNCCIDYAELLVKKSEEYLQVLVAKEFLTPSYKNKIA